MDCAILPHARRTAIFFLGFAVKFPVFGSVEKSGDSGRFGASKRKMNRFFKVFLD